jgi:hypothetical protein
MFQAADRNGHIQGPRASSASDMPTAPATIITDFQVVLSLVNSVCNVSNCLLVTVGCTGAPAEVDNRHTCICTSSVSSSLGQITVIIRVVNVA